MCVAHLWVNTAPHTEAEYQGGRAAWPACYANINKLAAAISGQSCFLSYHLVLLLNPDCPSGFLRLYECVCMCVSMRPETHSSLCMFLSKQVELTKSMYETKRTHIWFHSACLKFFACLVQITSRAPTLALQESR